VILERLTAIGPLAIDMYLPACPESRRALLHIARLQYYQPNNYFKTNFHQTYSYS
jgi:hypothetical protein